MTKAQKDTLFNITNSTLRWEKKEKHDKSFSDSLSNIVFQLKHFSPFCDWVGGGWWLKGVWQKREYLWLFFSFKECESVWIQVEINQGIMEESVLVNVV